ncbi:energy-coupling factor ABC transporter permease [Algicola sagamiensis]|uniref:energy-coupling factor ABC transporter permease n=1 Tax=Algicola sagamiensis TaxID=163869 RepID=UPI00036AD876|nr:energy-coupling factor ABC transporter permease [Algicola sagamiensis]
MEALNTLNVITGSALMVYLLLVFQSARQLPIGRMIQDTAYQHRIFACIFFLGFMWSLRASVLDGLSVHLVCLTAATLIFNWRVATVISFFALLAQTVFGVQSWAMLGVNGILGCLFPIWFSYVVFVVIYNYLPRHFFIYVFLCCFLTAGISIILTMFSYSFLFAANDIYSWEQILQGYLYFSALVWFPEATMNGMAITLMITYRPEWVATFYEKEYLND